MNNSIFKAYDIRGIYGENLNDVDAYLIGYYLVKYLKKDFFKIAHDKRNSYETLTKYLIEGILKAGGRVDYLGLMSTPNFYFSINLDENKTGVMITASHNPKEYNGFKIINEGFSFDSRNGLYDVQELVEKDEDNLKKEFEKIKEDLDKISLIEYIQNKNIRYNSTLELYAEHLFAKYENILSFDEKKILEGKNILIDFSSGVSSLANILYMKRTSLNFDFINYVVDGNFPFHSPDPKKAKDFIKSLDRKFDIGCCFDGDGDRIVFFDENKELILQDYIIAKFIDYFSDKNEKKFVCDLNVSKIVDDIAKEKSLEIKRMRVGRAFYQDYMEKNDICFGGELSGHLFFREFNYLDNPDIALIYILKFYAMYLLENKNNRNFSNLFISYEKYYKIEEISIKVEREPDYYLEKVKEAFNKYLVFEIDGYSFNVDDKFWFNVRKSNTENLIRINIEGVDEKKVEEGVEKIISIISKD